MIESQRSTASHPVTSNQQFYAIPGRKNLFSVCQDVHASEALEQASNILAAALDILRRHQGTEDIYGVQYLVEMSKAIVDSTYQGVDVKAAPNQLVVVQS